MLKNDAWRQRRGSARPKFDRPTIVAFRPNAEAPPAQPPRPVLLGPASLAPLFQASLADRGDEFLQESIDGLMIQLAIMGSDRHLLMTSRAWRSAAESIAIEQGRNPAAVINSLDFLTSDHKGARRIENCVTRILSGKVGAAKISSSITAGRRHHRFRVHMAPIKLGAALGVLIVNEDVTELEGLHQQTRRLTGQLIRSEEHERRRIAREMHDSTVQDLVAIGLNLRRLKHLADDAVVQEVLDEVHAILARTQQDVRTLSYLLHPPLLDEGGLVLALDALIRGLSTRMKIRIQFASDMSPDRLPIEIEMALYRVAQEGLINVHRHASATQATVRYHCDEGLLVLQVQDDGVGIGGADGRRVDSGVGISGMRARLVQLGGALTVSRLQRGTILTASIPLKRRKSDRV